MNFFHHQAVASPVDHLEVLATNSDGVIEALTLPGVRSGLGGHWHPGMLSNTHADHAALFFAFIAAAKSR